MKKCRDIRIPTSPSVKWGLIIALLIAVCIVGLMLTAHSTNDYVIDRYQKTLFVPENMVDQVDPELENLIRLYQPEPSKMIEIYTQDFDLAFRINFDVLKNSKYHYNNLKDYPELMEYFKTHKEGHAYYKTETNETDFYFNWYMVNAHGPDDTEHLVLIFTSRPEDASYILHDVLSCTILFLAFLIVIINSLEQRKIKLQQIDFNQNIIDSNN